MISSGPDRPRRSRNPCRDWLARSSALPPRPTCGHVVHPVGVRVVRHRRPDERRASGEGHAGGQGGPAAAGEPQQRGEQQDRGLECGSDADEEAAGALAAYGEAAEQHQQDRDDAGLAEPERVAHRQRQHQQADRDGCGQQGGTAADRLGQGSGGDQAERDDQQEGAEGPAPAEGLLGRSGERLHDPSAEGGAGEARRVVQRALHMQDTVRTDPGLQIGQPLPPGRTEDDGHLSYGEDHGDQPQAEPGRAQAGLGSRSRADGCRSESFRRSPTVLRIRHASSASRPVRPTRRMRRNT